MDVLKDLWRDKPLLIAVLAALALLLYLVYKANPGNVTAPSVQPGNIGNTSTMPEGQIQIINPAPVSILPAPTKSMPPPASSNPIAALLGVIRSKSFFQQQGAGWDLAHGGIPLRSVTVNNDPSNVKMIVPFSGNLQITGNAQNVGGTTWYPASYQGNQGFVNAYDVSNLA